jgi:hypothetical protein
MASSESSRVTSVPSSRLGKNLATNERSIGKQPVGTKAARRYQRRITVTWSG